MSEGFAKVGQLSDFSSGSMKKVQVNEEDVLVANISGRVYAIVDTCTHRGCSLSEGTIEGNVVTCPCHGGRFNITTGKVIGAPPKRDESSFEVRMQDSDVLVKKR
jgi:nitrite reductase/ring-hydroxylating ferredoxin subunit